MLPSIVRRRLGNALRSRLLLPALAAFGATVGGVAFGLINDDPVTAAGSIVFLPSAVLLLAIASRDETGRSTTDPGPGSGASTDVSE